jgi:aerobic carbon-monoxide dehydrogenase small subunit
MPTVTLTVNGKRHSVDVDPRTLLVQLLRENLRLTGTHVGCDTSQCGACVVHVNGRAVKSCTMFALSAEDAESLPCKAAAPMAPSPGGCSIGCSRTSASPSTAFPAPAPAP